MTIKKRKSNNPYGEKRVNEYYRDIHKEFLKKGKDGKVIDDDGEVYMDYDDYFEKKYKGAKEIFESIEKEMEKRGESFADEVRENTVFAKEWLEDEFMGEELRKKYKK